MARTSFWTDYLQTHAFWLFDIGPITSINLPVFTPVFGFASITAPEMSIETQDIPEGNWLYRRKVLRRANVSPMTLTRGVHFLDSDFWRWIMVGLTGDTSQSPIAFPGVTARRTMLLMHMFPRGPSSDKKLNAALAAGGITATAAVGVAQSGFINDLDTGLLASGNVLATAGAFTAFSLAGMEGFALSDGLGFRIPAKAFLLEGCIPTRYKVGSDFDATSAAVSIEELDFEYERFEEISLTSEF